MDVLTDTRLQTFLSNFTLAPTTDIQKKAVNALAKLDFPTTKDEYYKYTRLNKIANAKLHIGEISNGEIDLRAVLVSDQFLIIENGIFRKDLSAFNTAEVNVLIEDTANLKDTTANENDLFQTLNIAAAKQTVYISIPKNTKWEKPVQIIYINTSEHVMANTHLVIESEIGGQANIITNFISSKTAPTSFSNHFTEVRVAENAHITLDKIQAGNGWYIGSENINQGHNSTFKINTITLKGDIVRNNLNINVEGENCETYLNGAVITKNSQLVDNHTFVNHLISNCMSDENYKYVLDDKSTGVFNGRVIVQQDAQKINAYQQNGNVLLSDYAKINSKPELEIYADDVKCSHGSTTGQLDEDALFYLQARGISKEKARKILVSAFVREVLEDIDNTQLMAYVNSILTNEFGWTEI